MSPPLTRAWPVEEDDEWADRISTPDRGLFRSPQPTTVTSVPSDGGPYGQFTVDATEGGPPTWAGDRHVGRVWPGGWWYRCRYAAHPRLK
jgi:hypothetical protein